MSFVFVKDFVVNVGWAFIGEIGLAAAQAALTWWSRRPQPQRASASPATVARKKKSVSFDLSQNQVKEVERWISVGPATAAPKKKSVSFDLSRNEVKEVDNWFDPAIHKHRTVVFPGVHWNGVRLEHTVSRWIEPCGRWQRSFPRTTWPRDVPEDVEDDNGDIEMLDV